MTGRDVCYKLKVVLATLEVMIEIRIRGRVKFPTTRLDGEEHAAVASDPRLKVTTITEGGLGTPGVGVIVL